MSPDYRRVALYAVSCAVALAAAAAAALLPSPFAPRVHVRWSDAIEPRERQRLEGELRLLHGAHHDGRTWAYDLTDPSPARVRALLAHPAIADTHYIDRSTGTIAGDAPRGTSLGDGGAITAWRASPIVRWIGVFSGWSLLLSAVWLALNRRPSRAG